MQSHINLAKYPSETAKILHHGIFWFFLYDEEILSKTINDSNVDLEKFPANKVRWLAKKMQSSKATVGHIKQVACDQQAAQINLIRHQCTEIPPGKHKKKNVFIKPKQTSHKHAVQENPQPLSYNNKNVDPRNAHKNKDRCSKCGDSTHVEGFQCPAKKFLCKTCHKFGHFTSLSYQKKQASFKSRGPKAHQLQAGTVYTQEKAICGHSEDYSSSDDSFCLEIQVQYTQASTKMFPTPTHHITNLAYRLQPHHTWNQYLRAGLDTCVDVNIMPASVCCLLFKDPDVKKLDPCNMKIGTYTKDAVKIVGSCKILLSPPRH